MATVGGDEKPNLIPVPDEFGYSHPMPIPDIIFLDKNKSIL